MSPAAFAPTAGQHHDLPPHEVVLLLQSDRDRGLSEAEAIRRRAAVGPNQLPLGAHRGWFARAVRQFRNPLIYILLGSAVVTAALGEYVDCSVILGVVLVNAVVGYAQEARAEAELDSLRSMIESTATVVRDGLIRVVPSQALVPGDLVLLEPGHKVPADLRLLQAEGLAVDESPLTGESVPVLKDAVVLPSRTAVADRSNMAYSGTLVTSGSGEGLVVATGPTTELGQIHRLVGSAKQLDTPLTAKLAAFSRTLTGIILALAALTFAIGMVRGEDGVETFTAAVALAVGAIPEGLPAAVTITLAIGVSRMARRRAVVRRLPAVETLGGTTVICSDKTGTLTQNRMTVEQQWTPPGCDEAVERHWSLLACALCNDASPDAVGDPTEVALVEAAVAGGLDPAELVRQAPRLASVPFTSERGYMATVHSPGLWLACARADGLPMDAAPPLARPTDVVVLVKGAVERVGAACGCPCRTAAALEAAEVLAGGGLRVLATARAVLPANKVLFTDASGAAMVDEEALAGALELSGLQAMADPPRPAAAAAVAACHQAGIAVKMITGDHATTATAIARRIGILAPEPAQDGNGPHVLIGADIAVLDDESLAEKADGASVFARVAPADKLRLVQALQARGHVVAMTGDGVNDAPALRQADIGIAMGSTGTEVAKDASDMVLTDDDFATIEAAVEEGRGVFDNLTKFIVWTLPTNMGEGLVILVAILAGTALPILPTQVLWINMTTAVALGLMLAFEAKEPGIMRRPPRAPARPILTSGLALRTLIVSALLVGGSWWLFAWERSGGADLATARTAAVNLFVVVQAFYLFSCRSLTRSAWRLGPLSNRWLLLGVAVQAVLQAALTYLPFMNNLFRTAPIGPAVWVRILLVAGACAIVVAVHKRLHRNLI